MTLAHPQVKQMIATWQEELRRLTDNDAILLVSFTQPKQVIEFDYLSRIVCEATGVPFHKVIRRDRKRIVVLTRHLIAYYACSYTGMTLIQIAEALGAYDHTTIIRARERIKEMLETGDILTCVMNERINKALPCS